MLFAKKIEVRVIDQEQYLELAGVSNQDIIKLEKLENKVKISLSKSNVLYEDEMEIDFKEKLIYKKLLYKAICKYYENISPKWGILTGIRPVKIVTIFWDTCQIAYTEVTASRRPILIIGCRFSQIIEASPHELSDNPRMVLH